MRDRKPIPRNQSEITQAALNDAYLTSRGKPTIDSATQRHENRALQTTRKTDKVKDISIGLQDIDYAIKYYFDNIIKPTVVQDGQKMDVPIKYASPERWKSVQQDGYYRDTNGKLVLPIIIYKRDNVEKNRSLGNKVDGNAASLFQVFETRYNQRNQYDKFSILNNKIPSKQYYVSVVPDYVTITYSVSIFTNYVEQNNKIIEAIEFASDSYWGDENKWHFRTMLDSFSTTNIINSGEDKAAVTTVTLKVNGYLIADSVNSALANTNMHYSPAQIIFGLETTPDLKTISPKTQMPESNSARSTSFIGDGVNIRNTIVTGAALADLTYLNTNKALLATSITAPNIINIAGASILDPALSSSLPATTINNFIIYANGVLIPSSLATLVPYSGGVSIQINIAALGYPLQPDYQVIVIGKFQ
jgi:hypothetical protein